MLLSIHTIPAAYREKSSVALGPVEATPANITDALMSVQQTHRVVRLSRDTENWLEVGWHSKGFVLRENYEGVVYYSDAPNPSLDETSEQVAEYLNASIADLDEWFKAQYTQSSFRFITGRAIFELFHKRYRLHSFWSRTIAGTMLVLSVGIILGYLAKASAISRITLTVPVGLVALFFLKFDLREKKKKGKLHYHVSG